MEIVYYTPTSIFDSDLINLKQHIFEDKVLRNEEKGDGVSFCTKVLLTDSKQRDISIRLVKSEVFDERRICKVCLLRFEKRKKEEEI